MHDKERVLPQNIPQESPLLLEEALRSGSTALLAIDNVIIDLSDSEIRTLNLEDVCTLIKMFMGRGEIELRFLVRPHAFITNQDEITQLTTWIFANSGNIPFDVRVDQATNEGRVTYLVIHAPATPEVHE